MKKLPIVPIAKLRILSLLKNCKDLLLVAPLLSSMAQVGRKIITPNMPKKLDDKHSRNQRLQQLVDLLKFVISLDDREIVNSAIESVIDSLEDEINK